MITPMPSRPIHPGPGQQLAGAITCILLGCTPLLAAASCAELPPGTVEVTLLETPASQNFQYSYKQLRSLTEDHSRRDIETLGLTRGTATARFEIKGQTLQAQNGRSECASFTIKLSYGFSPIILYVSREFPPGTCAHNEIYRHELEHVETYQQHARAIRDEITQSLKQRFEKTTPWHGQPGENGPRLQRELDERWLPYIQRLLNKVKIAQQKIDSPEEYARIANSCDGEIKRIISGIRD